MNNQIRELEKQCWSHRVDNALIDGQLHFDTQKFARLIVEECAELTRWKDFDMSVEQRIRFSVYQDIKEHFGVEE